MLLIIAILNGASSHRRLVTACQYGLVDSLFFVPRSLFLCLVDLEHSSHHWANKYKNTLMCCGDGGGGCYRFAPGEQSALSAFTRQTDQDRDSQSARQTDREGDRQSVKQIERVIFISTTSKKKGDAAIRAAAVVTAREKKSTSVAASDGKKKKTDATERKSSPAAEAEEEEEEAAKETITFSLITLSPGRPPGSLDCQFLPRKGHSLRNGFTITNLWRSVLIKHLSALPSIESGNFSPSPHLFSSSQSSSVLFYWFLSVCVCWLLHFPRFFCSPVHSSVLRCAPAPSTPLSPEKSLCVFVSVCVCVQKFSSVQSIEWKGKHQRSLNTTEHHRTGHTINHCRHCHLHRHRLHQHSQNRKKFASEQSAFVPSERRRGHSPNRIC